MSIAFCGKIRYKSEQKVALHAIKCENKRPDTSLYWYWCGACEGYHLTHELMNKNADYFTRSKDFYKKEKKSFDKGKETIKGRKEFEKVKKTFKYQVPLILQ